MLLLVIMSFDKDTDTSINDATNSMSNIRLNDKLDKVCMCCLVKVDASGFRCGACRTARYCSRECQVKHWKVHKNICVDSNIEDSMEKLSMKCKNHYEQGNYAKAEKLYKKLLERLSGSLGENHPDTVSTMNNLASTYQYQCKYEEAEMLTSDAWIRGEHC